MTNFTYNGNGGLISKSTIYSVTTLQQIIITLKYNINTHNYKINKNYNPKIAWHSNKTTLQ
jgi:hypothetical protein